VAAISRALLKAPSNRFATMDDFGAALAGTGSRATANLEFTVPVANATGPVHAFESSTPHPSGKRRLASTVVLVLLLLLGVGGLAAWLGVGRDAPAQAAERVSSATTKGKATTTPSSRTKRSSQRTLALRVESKPRATIFINDVRAGETPLLNRQVTVGRTYQIRVERAGYRTRRETIIPSGTAPIRRSYVLERKR
jgi:hypothetical protein